MHGIRRTSQLSEKEQVERKARELAKIKSYTNLCDRLLERKRARDYSKEAFDLTGEVLTANPEFYTAWNYRRSIFIHGLFPSSSPSGVYDFLERDLAFTLRALKQHPKVYWIWNHRRWCLENIPSNLDEVDSDGLGWQRDTWSRELFVVEKMLDLDPRNFHAWNYRRYVLGSLPPIVSSDKSPTLVRSLASEIAYTTKKIESNFSNFSAWHQRSKVYAQTGQLADASVRDAEFEFVNQAMYTDPNDQSAWLYHRWLISQYPDVNTLNREIKIIKELLEEEPDSKWCLETLVQYGLLLKGLSSSSNAATQPPPPSSLDLEVKELLMKLIDIDPMRKARYLDISRQLDT